MNVHPLNVFITVTIPGQGHNNKMIHKIMLNRKQKADDCTTICASANFTADFALNNLAVIAKIMLEL
jgi:hypothetical protein